MQIRRAGTLSEDFGKALEKLAAVPGAPDAAPASSPAAPAAQVQQPAVDPQLQQMVGKQVTVGYAQGPVSDVITKVYPDGSLATQRGLVLQMDKATGRWIAVNSATGAGGGNLYADIQQ